MQSTSSGSLHKQKPGCDIPGVFALDNAATIYPSTIWKHQHHLYRVMVTLNEPVDPQVLQAALDVTAPRFPSIVVKLKTGFFAYSLQTVCPAPRVQEAKGQWLRHMSRKEMKTCCVRVLYDGCELAGEFFHGVCDGMPATIFLKSLLAEYIERKYGVSVPYEDGVLDRRAAPAESELRDDYPLYAGPDKAKRDAAQSFRPSHGTLLTYGLMHCRRFLLDEQSVLKKARENNVSITALLASVILYAMQRLRAEQNPRCRKAIRITVPVNLRALFGSATLRNFALVVNVDINPNQGEWSIDEICRRVYHQLGEKVTKKEMASAIAANVAIVNSPFFRYLPLFIKTPLISAAYLLYGSRGNCIAVSNLGNVKLPGAMSAYVSNFSYMSDSNALSPNSCAIWSFSGVLRVSMCRSIAETRLEEHVAAALQALGLNATIEDAH